MTNPTAIQRSSWVDWLAPGLVVGYLTMSRSFAHWGVGPLYIGEIALGAILLARPQALVRPWWRASVRVQPLSMVAWCFYISAVYGLLQCVRSVLLGMNATIAVQNLAFHAYPFFFFVGVWAGARHRNMLPSLVRTLAWVHGIYGVLFILWFDPQGWTDSLDGAADGYVGWFGQPNGAAVAMLGLLCYEPRMARAAIPLLLNAFVLLAIQVRAAWLGVMLAVPLWGLLTRRLTHVAIAFGAILLLLGLGLAADIEIPAAAGRDETITARNLVGRAIASYSPELASQFTDHVDFFSATVSWRTAWWSSLLKMIHESPTRTLFGAGYGYPIWEHHPDDLGDQPLRTPHNIFFFVLAYTGWVGVAIFYLTQYAIARVLWKTYKATGQAFGLCCWTLLLVWAHFDNFLEAPFGAIPLYLLIGMAAAPLASCTDQRRTSRERTA